MSTMSHRRAVAAIATGAILALPATSLADPPANEPHPHQSTYKDYSKNSVNGDYTPPRVNSPNHTQAGLATTQTAPPSDAFSWGDAAAGAAIALLVTGSAALGGRTIVRRRHLHSATPSKARHDPA